VRHREAAGRTEDDAQDRGRPRRAATSSPATAHSVRATSPVDGSASPRVIANPRAPGPPAP
jgi:hypothetical protein